jgi:PEP-CTERM motif
MHSPHLLKLVALNTVGLLSFCNAQNLQPPGATTGAQIAWASDAFATNYMADGVTTFEKALRMIRFELGTFSPGFDPRTATPEQWVSNWIVLQGTDYDLVDQQFIQTATLSSNNSPFLENAPAYIWGYTSKEVDPTSEWILVGAPSWKWPASNSLSPTTFSLGDAMPVDAFIGSVNPANGAYQMQLGYVVVPEPSFSMLAGLATLALIWRRKR